MGRFLLQMGFNAKEALFAIMYIPSTNVRLLEAEADLQFIKEGTCFVSLIVGMKK